MTKIKLCGLKRREDIECVNTLKPDYIGFVFFEKSSRFVSKEKAAELKRLLDKDIKAVGVFVDEDIKTVAELLKYEVIDIAQLHGNEDDAYIEELKALTDKPVIKAFKIKDEKDILQVNVSTADYVLLDSGAGGGELFDWSLIEKINRPYFLAGGLDCENVKEALEKLSPFAVDVSSGIETDKVKDPVKMKIFVNTVRKKA